MIYLDPDEPTNIVESYTFTFTYETDAEGNKVSLSNALSTSAARKLPEAVSFFSSLT